MSQVEFPSNEEYMMAVTAAAYTIASRDEKSFQGKKSRLEEKGISDISKSKKEDNKSTRIYSRRSFKWFSNKEAKDDSKSADQKMQNDPTVNHKSTEKRAGTIPTIKNATTFTSKYINDTGSKKFGSGNEARLGPKAQYTIKSTISSSSTQKKEGNSVKPNELETKADIWEKAETAKMKTRCEKMKSKISGWENAEKTKAKHRLEQKKRGAEQRRAKALEEYQNEISRIDKTCAEARVFVDETQMKDELKIREMARQMRSGDIPRACMCF